MSFGITHALVVSPVGIIILTGVSVSADEGG